MPFDARRGGLAPATTASPAQVSLTTADEAKLKAMIAQHRRVRSLLPVAHQTTLDQLAAEVKRHLFSLAPLRIGLSESAAQLVGRVVSAVTPPEAASLAEYVLGSIASGIAGGSGIGRTDAIWTRETQMTFNLQYLQLQSQMQHENRSYTAISNIMKTKHDTVKNSISNVR